ncbi:hypothetical protein SHIRM173S_00578 [Streptomyces hirsutus]
MQFTTRPTLQGTFGMVSSTHWLASQSAMAVLEGGGNAYDAAVAGAFVLHVVEPHLNGPAGEVPILLAPADGEVRVLCGQGVAPAGASAAHYRALGLDLVPGTGPLAAAVPGAFDAWMLLLRDHGTRSLADVLQYAVGYAEHGHAPVENVGGTVETVRELFETEWTSSAQVYLPGGRAPRPGELFRNPALAATWRRLLAEVAGAGGREAQIDAAREVWRTGFIAEALVRQAGRPTLDTSGEHRTGTLTAADLAGWSATYETPATYDWNGWTVCKAGPWSQGPVLLQQLALLPPDTAPWQYGSADCTHLLIEGSKLAMADREASYEGIRGEAPVWIIDPVDGTRQFVHGDTGFCTLVALALGGVVHASWTFAPVHEELATAVRDRAPSSTACGCTPVPRIPAAICAWPPPTRTSRRTTRSAPSWACGRTVWRPAPAARPDWSTWPSPAVSRTPPPSAGKPLGTTRRACSSSRRRAAPT